MNTFNTVRSEHLNHHNYLFGGQMLFWVDENAWLTAARDFPGQRLVTRGMERISFEKSVINGSILRFHILPVNQGKSSVQYQVDVYADSPGEDSEALVFSNKVTFVSIDCNGAKIPLPRQNKLRSQLEDVNSSSSSFSGGQPAFCEDPD